MNLQKIIIAIFILFIAQIFTWFQLFGQFKWDFLKNNLLLICLSGIPMTYLYFISTKIGVEGFGNSWALRIIQFITGIIMFTVLNHFILGESLNWKNGISLILCLVIILIQVIF